MMAAPQLDYDLSTREGRLARAKAARDFAERSKAAAVDLANERIAKAEADIRDADIQIAELEALAREPEFKGDLVVLGDC